MSMRCDRCAGETCTKAGRDCLGRRLWRCQSCARRLTARSASAFSGYRFPDEVIALAVRWYLWFRLSYVDVAEWLVERGITVDRRTIYGGTAMRSDTSGGWMRPCSRSVTVGGTLSVPSTRMARS